uniref:TNF superfamily member 13 n=1 Tax=Terrapene triunguis TaxID=2587831 RepID=A0A674K669_9SAUR
MLRGWPLGWRPRALTLVQAAVLGRSHKPLGSHHFVAEVGSQCRLVGLLKFPAAPSPLGDPGSGSHGAKGHRGEGRETGESLSLSFHLTPRETLGSPPITPTDEGDMTEIWWQPFLQQGPALEVSGPDVAVKQTGLYLVYSQVLFHDPTFTMGQVLWRASAGGPGQILLRCVQSMPREPEQAYNSCYSGGVFQLQRGDQLSLRVPRANASLDLSPHGTFLGLVRL